MKLNEFLTELSGHSLLRLVGPLATSSFPLDNPIIYVDGGLIHRSQEAHIYTSLGDGDSSPLKPELLFPSHKDSSDLKLALDLIPGGIKEVVLHGFLGGRRDHEWINFGVVHRFLKGRNNSCRVVWETPNIVSVSKGKWPFEFKGTFSLICFEDTLLNLQGKVEYEYTEIEKFPALSSRGLSNVSQGEFFVQSEGPFMVLRLES
ncbi:MAG: hypothetical protein KDD22_04545 [Bdellovibrionales bacterium]|nr:hypothetical protein [Bdellovibrionales bacterium]